MTYTIEDHENWENALEDNIYSNVTAKDKAESRESFVSSLKKAVTSGGKVMVEEFTTGTGFKVKNFTFKLNNKNLSYSISESDAIKYCGYISK